MRRFLSRFVAVSLMASCAVAGVPGSVVVTPTTLTTTEDGVSVQYSIVLSTAPANGEAVTITAASMDMTEGTVSGPLVFDQGNWSIPQFVTLQPGSSGDGNDGNVAYTIDHSLTSIPAGGVYSGVVVDSASVTNYNIDGVATIIVDPSSALSVSEDGSITRVVTIKAGPDVTPGADVTVSLTNNNPADVALSANSVTLTAGNGYSTSVTVSGVADNVKEANKPFTITTGASTSADAAYNGVNPPDIISSIVTDSNVVAVSVTPSTVPFAVGEIGVADTISYVLTAQPAADVSFTVSTDDATEATVSGSGTLTFTPADWNTPKVVTIAPVDDTVVDGTQPFLVSATPTVSADPFWNGVAVASVNATNVDNEVAAILVNSGDGVSTSEAGTTDTFTVVLGAEPMSNVSIDVRTDRPDEGLLSVTGAAPFAATQTLSFTPANWSVPQTVTVQGQSDAFVDGDQNYLIVTENVVSAAPGYSVLASDAVADVGAVNADIGVPSQPIPGMSLLSRILLVVLMLCVGGIVAVRIRS